MAYILRTKAESILKTELRMIGWLLSVTAVSDTETLQYAFERKDYLKQRLARLQGVSVNG
ncbi:hypothetical protein S101174_00992 [Levilactobacillus brevis]|nr:hypothetical protein S101174_00992 [Levilactobacillus brevis]